MTVWHTAGLLGSAYLVLLARSAWKQGELRQFLVSLAVVSVLIGFVAAGIAVALALEPR